jgi:hypothetical protein
VKRERGEKGEKGEKGEMSEKERREERSRRGEERATADPARTGTKGGRCVCRGGAHSGASLFLFFFFLFMFSRRADVQTCRRAVQTFWVS